MLKVGEKKVKKRMKSERKQMLTVLQRREQGKRKMKNLRERTKILTVLKTREQGKRKMKN